MEKKIRIVFRTLGIIIGSIAGLFIGYGFSQLDNYEPNQENLSNLTLFLCVLGFTVGCFIGFIIATAMAESYINKKRFE
jgi:uncharacterized protein YneF (UPF0154 family)